MQAYVRKIAESELKEIRLGDDEYVHFYDGIIVTHVQICEDKVCFTVDRPFEIVGRDVLPLVKTS